MLQGESMKFRKLSVIIDAVKFTGRNRYAIEKFMKVDSIGYSVWEGGLVKLHISTLEGVHEVSPGDWVIRGVKGEYYACKPDIFKLTYEKVKV